MNNPLVIGAEFNINLHSTRTHDCIVVKGTLVRMPEEGQTKADVLLTFGGGGTLKIEIPITNFLLMDRKRNCLTVQWPGCLPAGLV